MWVSAQTIFIRALHDEGKTIKVTYSNNTYDYILKGNVGRVLFFGSNPTALTIEMIRYGGNTNDATYRINTTQLTAPANVPTGRALADTLNKWLQTSYGSLGGTVDSIYFRGDTLFYNVIGQGELSVGIVDTVIAGLQTLFVAGDSLGISSGNTIRIPIANCLDIQACLSAVTEQSPFIQPPFTQLQSDVVYELQNNDLQFTGVQVNGDTLCRDFDPYGNDIGGYCNDNTIATGSLFNSIRGIGNSIDASSNLNTIYGVSNSISDNCEIVFINGTDIQVLSTVNQSVGYGEGHLISSSRAFVFGEFGLGNFQGIAIGNGTDTSSRSNSIELREDGSIRNTGAMANTATQIHQSGGDVTIGNNIRTLIYDPASSQSGATITLPLIKIDGMEVTILAGGTLLTGNVIDGWLLDGNGSSIIADLPNNLKVGGLTFKYIQSLNRWYKVNKGD